MLRWLPLCYQAENPRLGTRRVAKRGRRSSPLAGARATQAAAKIAALWRGVRARRSVWRMRDAGAHIVAIARGLLARRALRAQLRIRDALVNAPKT